MVYQLIVDNCQSVVDDIHDKTQCFFLLLFIMTNDIFL